MDSRSRMFNTYLQDLKHNHNEPLSDYEENITVPFSLGTPWQTFQQSMGERVNALESAMLHPFQGGEGRDRRLSRGELSSAWDCSGHR
jgi:hypothetical protein